MSTDFDEKQAFEDLRGILNYMHDFANYYFGEMQKAQQLNAEKDSEIADLKTEHEKKIDELKNFYYGIILVKDNKISALEQNLTAEKNNFEKQLNKYKESCAAVISQLQKFQDTLNEKDSALKKREEDLDEKEKILKDNRANLEEERAAFKTEKEAQELKELSAASAENFDEERQSLNQKISALEKQLKEQEENYQKQIDALQTTIKNLENQNEIKTREENPPALETPFDDENPPAVETPLADENPPATVPSAGCENDSGGGIEDKFNKVFGNN